MPTWRKRAAPLAFLALLLAPAALPAQVVAGFSLGVPAAGHNPHLGTISLQGRAGVALPPVPHVMVMWDLISVGFDRLQRQNAASIGTGLEAWISPAVHPALSHGPLILAEAGVGRRFGAGLHGFTSIGAGLGWSLGDAVPYVEYRRRLGFHAGRVPDQQILIGIHFVLFG